MGKSCSGSGRGVNLIHAPSELGISGPPGREGPIHANGNWPLEAANTYADQPHRPAADPIWATSALLRLNEIYAILKRDPPPPRPREFIQFRRRRRQVSIRAITPFHRRHRRSALRNIMHMHSLDHNLLATKTRLIPLRTQPTARLQCICSLSYASLASFEFESSARTFFNPCSHQNWRKNYAWVDEYSRERERERRQQIAQCARKHWRHACCAGL